MDWSELEAVYERYHQQLYRYCFSLVGNAEDAADALQNAMLKAVRALPGEQRHIELKPWLYRIAHNESIELLRRRRNQAELPHDLPAAGEPTETVIQRERLRRLLSDLGHLPERQRGALVMRELGGLGFEQIAEAFGTSPATARQTVYEARLSLRQIEAGREMSCKKAMRELSAADGRVTRRRDIQAHLRECAECSAFAESITSRRRDLAAISPLPAAASTALLHSLLGGKAGGGIGGTLAAGAGKTAIGSVALKSAATVAVVAVLGAGVADRTGLVQIGQSNSDSASERAERASKTGAGPAAVPNPAGEAGGAGRDGGSATAVGAARTGSTSPAAADPKGGEQPGGGAGSTNDTSPEEPADPAAGTLPPASAHGQETAAAHGGGRAQAGSHAQSGSNGRGSAHAKGRSGRSEHAKEHPKEHLPPQQGQDHQPPESPGKSAATGGGAGHRVPPPAAGIAPDNPPQAPFQPSESSPGQGQPNGQANPSKEAR